MARRRRAVSQSIALRAKAQITLLANAAAGAGDNDVSDIIQKAFKDLKLPAAYQLASDRALEDLRPKPRPASCSRSAWRSSSCT